MKRYLIGPMPESLPDGLTAKLARVEVATIGHFRHRGFMISGATTTVRADQEAALG